MILKSTILSLKYLQYSIRVDSSKQLSILFVDSYSLSSSTGELSVVPGGIRRVSPVVHRLVGVRHVPSHRLRGTISWVWGWRNYNTEWDKYQTVYCPLVQLFSYR